MGRNGTLVLKRAVTSALMLGRDFGFALVHGVAGNVQATCTRRGAQTAKGQRRLSEMNFECLSYIIIWFNIPSTTHFRNI
jgi:hypothetical protein